MKKITIGLLLLFAINILAEAQDTKKIRTMLVLADLPNSPKQRLIDVKVELDKLLADPKSQNNADVMALKAEVYGLIAGNDSLKARYPTANEEAFDALKKYLALEPTEKIYKDDGLRGLSPMYASLFNSGIQLYNAKSWDSALTFFKQVIDLSSIGISRKWFTTSFDTTAHLYAGVMAQNAKKDDDAAKYYGELASRKIKGKDYEGIYEFMTKYYLNQKNEAEFNKSIALAKEVYPENTMWNDLEFYYQSKNAEPADMLKKFTADDAANKLTSVNYFDYGNTFVNDKRIKDYDAAKRDEYIDKAVYAFEKSYEKDTTNALSSYNAGVTLYSQWQDLVDAARLIKGTTPDVKAKRAVADKVADAAADKSIPWMEKAFWSLLTKKDKSNLEKGCLSKSTDLLYNVYAYKQDRSRGVNPKDYDKFEAKAKFFDSLHGKTL